MLSVNYAECYFSHASQISP